MIETTSNVVAFRRRNPGPTRHPKSLMEAVYTAGAITLPADDVALKMAASMLQRLGFIEIEAVLADGTPRPLGIGEARRAMDRPWRLVKPGFAGEAGLPDGGGAFVKPV
jgi:hypothetical protein